MAAPVLPSGPGLLSSISKISKPSDISQEQFLDWYFEEHIPDVIATGGVESASFYINVDPNADRPFLALYPMQDLTFLNSDAFKKIRVSSKRLPGTGLCYDIMDVDARYYHRIQEYTANSNLKPCHGKFLMFAAVEPGDSTAGEFDDWYRKEHLKMLSKCRGYLRSTRYQLKYARTNIQSRVLKGLATEEEIKLAANLPTPPTWLALHEFDSEPDMGEVNKTTETEWSKRILSDVKSVNGSFYHLQKTW